MKELNINATIDNIDRITDFVNEQLEEIGCPMKVQFQIDVAIDEIISNISNYAYSPEIGEVSVRVDQKADPLAVVISFADAGVPFDPLSQADPDIALTAEERGVGGLGIFLVKKSMDDVTYEYKDGQNILTIRKNIHQV